MADQPKPDELNDELLSAYLDDELSAEERARVDERLAADPAARQLVEQLRSVSRAVQELPRETVGEDLRSAVLQRAERAMLAPGDRPAAGDTEPPRPADSPPSFTIGRSPRGWLWAGMAVAAALLLMVYQSGQEGDDLPDVAERRIEGVERADADRPGGLEIRALPEHPSSATASTSDSGARERTLGDEIVVRDAPAAAAPEPETLAESNDRFGSRVRDGLGVTDELTAGAEFSARRRGDVSAGRAAGVGGAAPDGLLADTSATVRPAVVDGDDLLVVHVNVRPAALRSRAFDELLVRNSIVVEEPPVEEAEEGLPALAGEERLEMDRSSAARADGQTAQPQDQDVDVVLVEAPALQIESCLDDLDADKENYLGVVIDDSTADEEAPAKQLASERNWQRYNRGRVTQQQIVAEPRSAELFYEQLGRARAYGFDRPAEATDDLSNAKASRDKMAKGRALRVPAQQLDRRDFQGQLPQRGVPAQTPASGKPAMADSYGGKVAGMEKKIELATDTLQVLFVLQAEPAAAAANEDAGP